MFCVEHPLIVLGPLFPPCRLVPILFVECSTYPPGTKALAPGLSLPGISLCMALRLHFALQDETGTIPAIIANSYCLWPICVNPTDLKEVP